MKDLELLDIIAIISLYYQVDSNAQLRSQSTNDDILSEMKLLVTELIEQNKQTIQLLNEAVKLLKGDTDESS